MGKGYFAPYFARITMLLFPGFCVLVGIAGCDLQLILRKKSPTAVVLTGALLLVFVPSILFDIAYSRAMQQKDARQILREDLQKFIGEAPATIGILHLPTYFYTVMPAAQSLNSERVAVRVQDAGQNADFLLVGFPQQISPPKITRAVLTVYPP